MNMHTATVIMCALILGWFALAAWVYLLKAFHDWRLGRAWRKHRGLDDAWRKLRAEQALEDEVNDALIRRGMRELARVEPLQIAKHPSWKWHLREPPGPRPPPTPRNAA